MHDGVVEVDLGERAPPLIAPAAAAASCEASTETRSCSEILACAAACAAVAFVALLRARSNVWVETALVRTQLGGPVEITLGAFDSAAADWASASAWAITERWSAADFAHLRPPPAARRHRRGHGRREPDSPDVDPEATSPLLDYLIVDDVGRFRAKW